MCWSYNMVGMSASVKCETHTQLLVICDHVCGFPSSVSPSPSCFRASLSCSWIFDVGLIVKLILGRCQWGFLCLSFIDQTDHLWLLHLWIMKLLNQTHRPGSTRENILTHVNIWTVRAAIFIVQSDLFLFISLSLFVGFSEEEQCQFTEGTVYQTDTCILSTRL